MKIKNITLLLILAVGAIILSGYLYIRFADCPKFNPFWMLYDKLPKLNNPSCVGLTLDAEARYGKPPDIILTNEYDLRKLEGHARGKCYHTEFGEYIYSLDNPLDFFNEYYNTSFKEDYFVKNGRYTINVSKGRVYYTTHYLRISKRKSINEVYEIMIVDSGRPYLDRQTLFSPMFWGDCDTNEEYLKSQVKDMLMDLGIEHQWIENSTVGRYSKAALT